MTCIQSEIKMLIILSYFLYKIILYLYSSERNYILRAGLGLMVSLNCKVCGLYDVTKSIFLGFVIVEEEMHQNQFGIFITLL